MRTVTITSIVLALASSSFTQKTYNIDPSSVSSSDRQSWCLNQKTQCPLICLQTNNGESATTRSNTCDPKNLEYSCVCEDGTSPNLTEYSLTIPFYECQEFGNQCVKNCGLANNACADRCRADNLCGAQSPTLSNTTSTVGPKSTTGPSATSGAADADATGDNFQSLDGSDNNQGGNNGNNGGTGAAGVLGANFGFAVLVSGLIGGFAVLL
ncbi:hypothetical protein EJ05DRAFT_504298 [Pseudovirgaria hyperparasitica]|uniref:DUF7707 domain-containing protein n=1 Tax=Pseudovirgaria hyperparasitica TaxID=470096 RepID=A0A6A6VY34_9PEZI|nr:uncharacterized protein EJ05DRAFT_504298 [Pseudovirgaria hyperparasitica]KAF2754197.1 hypothetical protein EJ05DRAFT_504298 [Pseudovirgaria hyperparasitica]